MQRRWILALVGALAVGLATVASAQKKGYFAPVKTVEIAEFQITLGIDPYKPYPFISSVAKGSAARAFGIKKGDELVQVQGEHVRSAVKVQKRIARMRPFTRVEFWLRRGARDFKVTLRKPRSLEALKKAQAKRAAKKAGRKKHRSRRSSLDPKTGKKKARKKRQPAIVIKPLPRDDDGGF